MLSDIGLERGQEKTLIQFSSVVNSARIVLTHVYNINCALGSHQIMEPCKSCGNLNPDLANTRLGHLGHFLDLLGVTVELLRSCEFWVRIWGLLGQGREV